MWPYFQSPLFEHSRKLKYIYWLNYCLGGEAGGGDEVVELFSALHAPPPGWPPTDPVGDL